VYDVMALVSEWVAGYEGLGGGIAAFNNPDWSGSRDPKLGKVRLHNDMMIHMHLLHGHDGVSNDGNEQQRDDDDDNGCQWWVIDRMMGVLALRLSAVK